jgi:hypothetical protein
LHYLKNYFLIILLFVCSIDRFDHLDGKLNH